MEKIKPIVAETKISNTRQLINDCSFGKLVLSVHKALNHRFWRNTHNKYQPPDWDIEERKECRTFGEEILATKKSFETECVF